MPLPFSAFSLRPSCCSSLRRLREHSSSKYSTSSNFLQSRPKSPITRRSPMNRILPSKSLRRKICNRWRSARRAQARTTSKHIIQNADFKSKQGRVKHHMCVCVLLMCQPCLSNWDGSRPHFPSQVIWLWLIPEDISQWQTSVHEPKVQSWGAAVKVSGPVSNPFDAWKSFDPKFSGSCSSWIKEAAEQFSGRKSLQNMWLLYRAAAAGGGEARTKQKLRPLFFASAVSLSLSRYVDRSAKCWHGLVKLRRFCFTSNEIKCELLFSNCADSSLKV